MKTTWWVCVGSVLLCQDAASQSMSPKEIHDRIAAIMERVAHRPIVAGDTFVTWSPNPVLYTTVRWGYRSEASSSLSSSLVRNDGMVGTTDAEWQSGLPISVSVRWTTPDSVLLVVEARLDGDLIRLRGSNDTTLSTPDGLWAIFDYGMEDQALPLIRRLSPGISHPVLVYRPFPGKWDRLEMTVVESGSFRRVMVKNAEGEEFYWTVTDDDALVRITRSNDEDSERRPLETTQRFADYVQSARSR